MQPNNTILVALDFTSCSVDAFQRAQRIAAWKNAPLTVLHVAEVPVRLAADIHVPGIVIPMASESELIADSRRKWNTLVACSGGANAKFVVQVGNPRDCILTYVEKERPGMLVIGANSQPDAHRGMGATAAACAQWADTRVLLIREGQAEPFRAITVCVDFSETSRLALEEAVAIATEDGARLHVLHVYSDPWYGLTPPDDIQRNMPDFTDRYRIAVEDRLREFCRPLAHELGALKAEYHALMAAKHADGIKTFVERHGSDLVVLGTRGKFNLRDFFWGSTAERVVREAPCSVLAIKPPAPADATRRDAHVDHAGVR